MRLVRPDLLNPTEGRRCFRNRRVSVRSKVLNTPNRSIKIRPENRSITEIGIFRWYLVALAIAVGLWGQKTACRGFRNERRKQST